MRELGLFGSIVVLGCASTPAGGGGDSTSGGETSSTTAGSAETSTISSSATVADSTGADTSSVGSEGPASSDEGGSSSSTGGEDKPNVDVSDPQLYEFELDPLVLDPTCVDNLELQYAHLDTRAEPIGKLVFFLSGYTNTPASWRDHGRQIASWGFHVVEPHYNNRWDCGAMGGTCNEDTRWEALTGEDTSTVIVASRADSAEGRVVTMLKYLADAHPGGDWGWYLDENDNLRYEHVVMAGISHGAASTGLFATRRPFSRAVMHSGGWWNVVDPMTPIDLFYGLAHTADDQYAGIVSTWEGAGMLGVTTSIDDAMPPYGDAHQLVTSIANGYPHCSTCVSPDSPMMGDAYIFDPAWRYMYGAPQLP